MLDIMRKHASSWLIKVILGAIIITFIFFFGYSSYRKGMRGGRVGAEGGVVAKVNGTPVSAAEYEFFFDRNFERMKAQFEGKEIPAFVRQIAESQTLQMLVGREIQLQQADALGIVIPDDELADTIREGQAAQAGGEFDPVAYRHQFLPSFRQRFNMDYEQFVRQDLRLGAFQELFAAVDRKPADAQDEKPKETVWTFETVAIDAGDEGRALADKLASAAPAEWPKILKSAKLELKKVGPIRIEERTQLLGGKATLADYQAVFALTRERPAVAKPLEIEGKLHLVRLVERAEREAKVPPHEMGGFFAAWMEKLLAKAKVENYLKKEQQQ